RDDLDELVRIIRRHQCHKDHSDNRYCKSDIDHQGHFPFKITRLVACRSVQKYKHDDDDDHQQYENRYDRRTCMIQFYHNNYLLSCVNCWSVNVLYIVWASISSAWVPLPVRCPFSMKNILSELMIVLRRWAMTRTVRPSISSSSASWTNRSERESRLAVASSSINISGSFKNARAMPIL